MTLQRVVSYCPVHAADLEDAETEAHVQLPRELLTQPKLTGLDCWLWCRYAALMPKLKGQAGNPGDPFAEEPTPTRGPAWIGRAPLQAEAEFGRSQLDEARRNLIRYGLITRYQPGRRRTNRHWAKYIPVKGDDIRFVKAPRWTMGLVSGVRAADRAPGRVHPEEWRTYLDLADRAQSDGWQKDPFSNATLGEWMSVSGKTARRRLESLEHAGLAKVNERPGQPSDIWVPLCQCLVLGRRGPLAPVLVDSPF